MLLLYIDGVTGVFSRCSVLSGVLGRCVRMLVVLRNDDVLRCGSGLGVLSGCDAWCHIRAVEYLCCIACWSCIHDTETICSVLLVLSAGC